MMSLWPSPWWKLIIQQYPDDTVAKVCRSETGAFLRGFCEEKWTQMVFFLTGLNTKTLLFQSRSNEQVQCIGQITQDWFYKLNYPFLPSMHNPGGKSPDNLSPCLSLKQGVDRVHHLFRVIANSKTASVLSL